MSKFAAWAQNLALNNHGIRLQAYGVTPGQARQAIPFSTLDTFFCGVDVEAGSTLPSPDWDERHIIDGDPSTVWSSARSSSPNANIYFAFWWGKQCVNGLELTPRRLHDGTALCFPSRIEIRASVGPNNWQFIGSFALDNPVPGSQSVIIPFDCTVEADGFMVSARQLRPDDNGSYYFQMAGARARYRSLDFNEAATHSLAAQFPTTLFFFGDEPNSGGNSLPADEYARVYGKFVAAIKSGSPIARVSPAGICECDTAYADYFVKANNSPVDEWRFHKFYWPERYSAWETAVRNAIAWCRDHGAPMVLGSFGSPAPELAEMDMRQYQQQAMTMIAQESNIVEAVWWSFDHFNGDDSGHLLVMPDGTLTKDGELFVSLM